jgi:6-pyruvoyltetrahydropterin/6-carboxytetrahydropterin synthase
VERFTTIELHKEEFSFSAGHFTIFSATEREQLHGHNYNISATFKTKIKHNGLSFDYRYYKNKINSFCDLLDRYLLLPTQSPHLKIDDAGEYWEAHFNNKKLPFLKEDVVLLPVTNITIEELSHWFLQKVLEDEQVLDEHMIAEITIKVYNGPGQSGNSSYVRN